MAPILVHLPLMSQVRSSGTPRTALSRAESYSTASDLPPELVLTIMRNIPSMVLKNGGGERGIASENGKDGEAGASKTGGDKANDTSTNDRRSLSLCASTCKTWARYLQPILYATITLRSQEDLQTLLIFLKSPSSGVRHYIRNLHVEESSTLRPWSHISTLALQRRLTALESLSQVYVPPDSVESAAIPYPSTINDLPALRNSFNAVVKLSLCNYNFPTFSSFERMIRSLPIVADIACENITWRGPVDRSRVPKLRSNSIQQLRASNCPDLWTFFWLLRSSESPNGDYGLLSPSEIPCIIDVASHLFDVKRFIDTTFQVLRDKPEGTGKWLL